MVARTIPKTTMTMETVSLMAWMIVMIPRPNTTGAVVWPMITTPTDVTMPTKISTTTAMAFSTNLTHALGIHTTELGHLHQRTITMVMVAMTTMTMLMTTMTESMMSMKRAMNSIAVLAEKPGGLPILALTKMAMVA